MGHDRRAFDRVAVRDRDPVAQKSGGVLPNRLLELLPRDASVPRVLEGARRPFGPGLQDEKARDRPHGSLPHLAGLAIRSPRGIGEPPDIAPRGSQSIDDYS